MTTLLKETIARRLPAGNKNGAAAENPATLRLKKYSAASNDELLQLLDTNPLGISNDEAEERQEQHGLNEVVHEKVAPWYVQLVQAFIDPFMGVLAILAAVSLVTDVILQTPENRDYKTVIVISVIMLLSSFIRFWQEFKSNVAAEKLRAMVKTTATVLRSDAGRAELDIKDLVPGDIIQLSAGDMIPADVRIFQCKDLFVSQAILTGEALPVEKRELPTEGVANKTLLDLDNLCFMGTNVVSGTATAVVVAIGNDTYFGSMAKNLTGKRAETNFDKGVNSVSWLLIKFMAVMVPIVFVVNGITKHDWLEAFLFAISVAVGLTPAMLPMIVTANLARGAVNMSKRKVVVKRLNAIQNIGAMDVLCTDKTGTLTLDKIVLERHIDVRGEDNDEVLKWAFLNSYHQTGLKNLLDLAVLDQAEEKGIPRLLDTYKKVDEIPFDFMRRRMSVILEEEDRDQLLVCKGAMEEMLKACSHALDPETKEIVPLDEEMRAEIVATTHRLNEDGLRVLLVAIKEFAERPLTYTVADETNMVLTGFIGFLDPPKPSAKPAIKALMKLGVTVKVLTGDNDVVTRKICREVGIPVNHVLLGSDVEAMSDTELEKIIDEVSILAKLSPVQKSRVVKVLQAKGHTVGFLGDGINDAAALRDADVGISVDTAVDIAKESADIILLEKDLMVLRKGVIYGRRTFGNIIKYIKMAASSNFGNMFSVLGASILLPFLPMLPIHLLVQNLLYDISQISIPWDKMDAEFIETPRKWDASGISRFLFFVGPTSSIFDYVTFFVMYFVFKANTPEHQSLFQSGWFIEGLLSQTLIVHMIRTRKIPFIQSSATTPVVVLTLVIMAVGIYIPFSPFASAFKLQALPWTYFPVLFVILLAYSLSVQVVKVWYMKRFGEWL